MNSTEMTRFSLPANYRPVFWDELASRVPLTPEAEAAAIAALEAVRKLHSEGDIAWGPNLAQVIDNSISELRGVAPAS